MIWLLGVLAFAAPPDKTARLYQVSDTTTGTDRMGNMSVSADGRMISGRTAGTGTGWVLDVDTWVITEFSGCDVVGVGVDAIAYDDGYTEYTAWFGCSDGEVIPKQLYDGAFYDYTDEDGAAVTFLTPIEAGKEAVALWVDPTSGGVVILATATNAMEAFYYDGAAFSLVDPPTSLAVVTFPDYLDSQFVLDNPFVGPAVMITHARNQHSYLTFTNTGTGSFQVISDGGQRCDDWADSFYNVYCLDEQGQLLTWNGTLSGTPFVSLNGSLGYVLDEPLAVVVSSDEDDSWLAVTGGQIVVWRLSNTGTVLLEADSQPYFKGDPSNDNQIQDGVYSEGVLFGGGISGNLHISTAKPWMKNSLGASTVEQDGPASTGDFVPLRFEWDEAVTWAAYRGGDRNDRGTLITSGTVDADVSVSLEVLVDDDWEEGLNPVYIFGESTRTGSEVTGHGRLDVDVDNPPKAPKITAASVSAGDQQLTITFAGISDADLAYYDLYMSTQPFVAADFETGGPSLEANRPKTPVRITSSPGAQVVEQIGPLENGVTYYMAVRAFDDGGKEGPMSNVVSGTPEQAFSAAELAGEPGGTPCSTSGAAATGSLFLLALASLRRRHSSAALGLGLVAASLVAPANARAADDEDKWWRADLTPATGNFELRYGGIGLEDPDLVKVYKDKPTNLLQMEFGPQIFRIVEIDGGLGFFQELAKSVTTSGAQSGDRTMLTWYQLSLDGTLRAHILDEQPLVPFVRYGWDYVMWNEKTVEFGGQRQKQGGKFGSHYALGVNVLLDLFQPGRASLLEARSGINDTWLTIEWRRQTVDNRDMPWAAPFDPPGKALNFSGDGIQVGLKLDY